VTVSTNRPVAAALAMSSFTAAVDQARPLIGAPGLLRRSVHIIGDVVAVMGVVLCIPFVILAIGTPIALCVRFLVWIAGML
jgi:hypothetical protein